MDRPYSRKRSVSPSSRGGRPYRSRADGGADRYAREYRESDKPRRSPYSSVSEDSRKEVRKVSGPAGFPECYSWGKGDWLCPSIGCEGHVTAFRFRNCVSCGRSQPHFTVLMELAKSNEYRTSLCPALPDCPGRACIYAHTSAELRSSSKARILQKSPDSPPVVFPAPTLEEIATFVSRWKIPDLAALLKRLPGPLCDLILRSFMVPAVIPDEDLSRALLKCLADIIRPKTISVNTPSAFHELVTGLLKVYSGPVGIACSAAGQLAVTLEKEVALVRIRDHSNEDLGLLAFALAFTGLGVVYSLADKINLASNFPKVYCDMFNRVRLVDNPSETIYTAIDPTEEITDRATQAKMDALTNPAPLLPTPDVMTNSSDCQ